MASNEGTDQPSSLVDIQQVEGTDQPSSLVDIQQVEGTDQPSSLVDIKQQVEDDVEDRLLNVVSKWWEEYGSINMLKILLHQFVPPVSKGDLGRAKDVWSLFRILKGIGEFNRPYHVIVFDAVTICGLKGVQLEIKKIERFKDFKFSDVADSDSHIFDTFYRNMILFGKLLDEESTRNIGKVCNIGEDVHNDNEWLLILALMKKNFTGNMTQMTRFIVLLQEKGMNEEAKLLERIFQ